MQKHVHLVDLVKSFPTNIFLQNLASTQKRTNPVKLDHLAEKSEQSSISNLSTKLQTEPSHFALAEAALHQQIIRDFHVRGVLQDAIVRFESPIFATVDP